MAVIGIFRKFTLLKLSYLSKDMDEGILET